MTQNNSLLNLLILDEEKQISINSFCIALLLTANYVSGVLRINNSIIVIMFLIFIIQLSTFQYNKTSIKHIFLISFILFVMVVSVLISRMTNKPIDYLSKFMLFGIIPLFLSTVKYKYETVFKAIIVISILSIPLLIRIDYMSYKGAYRMGFSYALIPIFACSILLLHYSIKYKIMSIIMLLITIPIIIEVGTRGVLVTLGIFLTLYSISKYIKYSYLRFLLSTLLILIVYIIFKNILVIFINVQTFLKTYDISIHALDRSIYYYGIGNLFNYRDVLWNYAFIGIKDSLIYGHGIGSFEQVYEGFIHNIFLHSMWEGGFIFFLPILLLFVFSIYKIMKQPHSEKIAFIILLLTTSYFSLMFSSVFWMNQSFWFLTGMFLKPKNIELSKN